MKTRFPIDMPAWMAAGALASAQSRLQLKGFNSGTVASSKLPDEVREKMKRRFPGLGSETLLHSRSQAAFPPAN